MNDKKNDINKDIFKSVIYVTLGLIMLVVAIIHIPNSYITIDNDWIGFYGAIIGSLVGGYITFIGIQITINHNEKIRLNSQKEIQERKRLEILPHITVEIDPFIKDFDDANIQYEEDSEDYIGIKLRNIGRDSCVNLTWDFTFKNTDVRSKQTPYYIVSHNSLTKNEYSKQYVIGVNELTHDLISIEVMFCDLEYREYIQKINISLSYPIKLGDTIEYVIESQKPELIINN